MKPIAGFCAVWSLALLAGGVGCVDKGATENTLPQEEPTTIVLITVDGLIADQLALRGGPLSTPNLESLAGEGTFWGDAWTACPMTRPGVATYLSGLAPDRHGVRDDLFTFLPEGTSTLAELLAERGYRSAAFPDSSFLGFGSGLLDGFDLVADPPPVPVRPERWLPVARPAEDVARDFVTWLAAEPEAQRLFGWAHFSRPLVERMMQRPKYEERKSKGKRKSPRDEQAEDVPRAQGYEQAVAEFDAAVGTILETVALRGNVGRTLVIVAGTQGDPGGSTTVPRGAGFSLAEAALQIPVIVRFPSGLTQTRDGDDPVWSPDVAATIAALAGASLPAGTEGIELTRPAPPDRVMFAWSWATRDQMGWRSLRAARFEKVKRLEGLDERTSSLEEGETVADPAVAANLSQALALRAEPAAPQVPLEEVRPFLEARGLTLDPVGPQGRAFGTPAERSLVARDVWLGRRAARLGRLKQARIKFEAARSNDPACLAALLDLGMVWYFSGREEAAELLGRAAELYPTEPEVLHWYAHALWSGSWEDAEQLLLFVLPHQPRDTDLLYDLACARSRAGDLEASERYLRDAIAGGYENWAHMETDGDLRNLRESGRFAAVLREVRR